MRLTAVLVLCGVLMTGGAGRADTNLSVQYWQKAMVLYNLQKFDQALRLFQDAYIEHSDPTFLFNIAQCQRQLGRSDEAAKSYRAYAAQIPEGPSRDEARRLIAEMDQASAIRRAALPPPGPIAPPTSLVQDKSERHWYKNPVGWTLVGVGVAGLAVSAGMFAHSNDLDNQLGSASSLVQVQQLQSDRDTYKTAGIATVVIGGAVTLAGGVVLGVMGR